MIFIGLLFIIAIIAGVFFASYVYSQSSNSKSNHSQNEKQGSSLQNNDPCGGSGGNEQIVDIEDNTITVKGKYGDTQTLTVTERTIIKTSSGLATNSELKMGDRVTVETGNSGEAATILLCNAAK